MPTYHNISYLNKHQLRALNQFFIFLRYAYSVDVYLKDSSGRHNLYILVELSNKFIRLTKAKQQKLITDVNHLNFI